MARKDVDSKRLQVRRRPAAAGGGVRMLEPMIVVVTRLFCPKGHNVVGTGPTRFDGFDGIGLWVSDGKKEGLVELSPIHGDASKAGPEFRKGTRLSVKCPVCRLELPVLARCSCASKGELRKLFTSEKLDDAHAVALCDVWGCTRSRVIDGNEILSEWLAGRIDPTDPS
jgi:hypothetical protein